jgi:hypothetical protein
MKRKILQTYNNVSQGECNYSGSLLDDLKLLTSPLEIHKKRFK